MDDFGIEHLESFLVDINELFEECRFFYHEEDVEIIEKTITELEKAQELLSCFTTAFHEFSDISVYQEIIVKLNEVLELFDRYRIHYENKFQTLVVRARSSATSKVILYQNGNVGRNKFIISEEQVTGLRSLRMSWTKIAHLMGISVDTLRRRRKEFSKEITYHQLTDLELDNLLNDTLSKHPCLGERMLQGHLVADGYIIQRARVRESLNRIDPDRAHRFNKRKIFRRTYNVLCSNALWLVIIFCVYKTFCISEELLNYNL